MMSRDSQIELGLVIPLQWHLHIKDLPCGQRPDRRFCWNPHVISMRGCLSLLAVHCHSWYTFMLYDLSRRGVAFLNQAWDDVMAAGLALDEGTQSQPLLGQISASVPATVGPLWAEASGGVG